MVNNVVRYGIVGVGNMGTGHLHTLLSGKITGAQLHAVCDVSEARRETLKKEHPDLHVYDSASSLFQSGTVDAVIIATPHYDHPDEAIEAFQAGLHVLVEKPAGVYISQVERMNRAAEATDRKFGIVYNQRMNPLYKKLKELVESGELGEIRRTNWIITNWYRSQAYYDSGTWRATWAGEGGGVLINQCPHQLDLWQWTIGMMPSRMRAFCQFGKHRDIEVENDVTAYVEYPNGATGVFITSTSDAPGTNRLEVCGDRGKVVIEDGNLTFWRLRETETEFNARNKQLFGQPECWTISIPVDGTNPEHAGILQNFTDAVLHDAPLVAPGEEGIRGLTISNAMHLSTWLDDWVEFPLNAALHEAELRKRIAGSKFKPEKADAQAQPADLSGTY
ncbi:Gfo/Idh/MocA family protein [Paenibacillus gansuensis]|uniref:Gfo/Idh/MocA family protein n=1 Tax=Paenibacillus gansuensis TaxID=306542 RepID=A0ABW5PKA9_9BACL